MTDEKKKPEEDEVSDEQLEEVAGGLTAIGGQTLIEPTTPPQGAGVFSKARVIPVAGTGLGGEPEAVMGDLSALGGPKGDDSV